MTGKESRVSRRELLATTGSALIAGMAFGHAGQTEAANRHPGRGGTLRFATSSDSMGLDPHRNIYYIFNNLLVVTTMGLLDLNLRSEPVPGIAAAWEVSMDLLTYTFILRKGVLFHNGREVDAAAVKWNFERMQDPKKSHPFIRSALENLKDTMVVDKYTFRCHLYQPSASFPANVIYYPCSLMAPDSKEQADVHPIGCGPFKFVKWERYSVTLLERFENYFETDAEGNNLPYLGAIEGRPKQMDRVRLTALQSGQVDLINNMAYADAAAFSIRHARQYQRWISISGTTFISFNLEKGPFADKWVRQAAAHAIDHEVIHQAVFSGQGNIATGFYDPDSPWYMPNTRPWPQYDPDKARFLLRKAKAVGTNIILQAHNFWPHMQQTGELLQAMWSEVGFKVNYSIYDSAVLLQKRRAGDFQADSMAASYRFDPDGWFSRQILSTSPITQHQSRFRNDRADKLILEARQTASKERRLELYTEIESIVNEELPILYIHHLPQNQAGSTSLKGYQPSNSGVFSTQGAGIRSTWLL